MTNWVEECGVPAEELETLSLFGWEPGGYTVRCVDCMPTGFLPAKYMEMGSKRSVRCLSCARAAAAKSPLPKVAPVRAPVRIEYTNYKGERRIRTILPLEFLWGQNKYHPDYQYLLYATDLEKNANRYFAVEHIHSWAAVDKSVLT